MQRRKPYRNKKILQAARGQSCTMNSPVCNYDTETVVFCHSNLSEDGKGMGQKADDCFGFFGCSACHDWFDGRAQCVGAIEVRRDEYFHSAMKRTLRILLDDGVLK